MALISCPKCRKQISSEASACRHCGRKQGVEYEQPGAANKFTVHFIISTFTAAVGALLYIGAINGAIESPLALSAGPYLLILGIVWYVGVRIWSSISRYK